MASLKNQFKREWNALAWAIRWCTDPMHRNWPWYGGRGITVCPAWIDSFETFLKDVGPKPKDSNSRLIWLGRLDVNKGYEPGNCAWVPRQRQITHRRFCHRIPCNDKELTIEEAAREMGICADRLRLRIVQQGMDPSEAVSRSLRRHRKNSVLLTHGGATMSTLEWENKLGLTRGNLRNRLRRGMPLEKALQPGDFRKLRRPRKVSRL